MNELQNTISRMISMYGVKAVLKAVSDDIENRENLIRETSDRNLSNAFDFMFPAMVKAQPKLGKKLGSLVRMVLKSVPVRESLKIIKADSENHSPAMKEAFKEWSSWDNKPHEVGN